MDGLNRQQADTLYKTLQEEVASLDFTSWYSYLTARPYGNPVFTNGYDVSGHSFLPSVMLYGSLGTRSYQTAIPLGTLLPKTSAQYMQLSNESQSIDVLACLKRSDWSEYDSLRVQALQFLDENGRPRSFERYFSGDMLQLLQEPLADLAGALEGLSNTAPDITKPLYGFFWKLGKANEPSCIEMRQTVRFRTFSSNLANHNETAWPENGRAVLFLP